MKFLQEMIDATQHLAQNKHVEKFALVGSATFHEDPQDLDFLVLLKEDAEENEVHATQRPSGYFRGMDETFLPRDSGAEYQEMGTGTIWGACRAGAVNLICTKDKAWYERFKLASEVVTALQLREKLDRITVYRVVRDGETGKAARDAAVASYKAEKARGGQASY